MIAIESIADPSILREILDEINNKKFGCVYDTGNRANQLNNQDLEIIHLSKYINHVHLKDKDLNKNNVVLGTGIVDFKKIFFALKKIDYKGYCSFETNRGGRSY